MAETREMLCESCKEVRLHKHMRTRVSCAALPGAEVIRGAWKCLCGKECDTTERIDVMEEYSERGAARKRKDPRDERIGNLKKQLAIALGCQHYSQGNGVCKSCLLQIAEVALRHCVLIL